MGKLTKKAAILEQLHTLVTKQAEVAQTNISGEPGKDTGVTSISESTEHTDKNAVGPDKLNDKQKYEQKPSSDPCEPVANAKSAEDISAQPEPVNIDKLANDILASIQSKVAAAQTNITGEPGKDTNVTAISESTENTDKNAVGPEKLNDKQKYEQKPASDPAEPASKTAAEKQASYDLGRKFCELLVKKAEELQKTAAEVENTELLKEAGRRDLDTIIEQATAKFANEKAAAAQAQYEEQQGALAFDLLHKQAQLEQVIEDNRLMAQKLAEYAELEKQAAAKQAEESKAEETTKIASIVAEILKRELSAKVA